MTLTAEAVNELVTKCLYQEDEIDSEVGGAPKDAIVVEGIVRTFGFHPERVQEAKSEIRAFVRELPDEFLTTGGGGMSFLQLCKDKHGHQWAEHGTMEGLVAIAIAANIGNYCVPREMWSVFPGGVPYVVFNPEDPN